MVVYDWLDGQGSVAAGQSIADGRIGSAGHSGRIGGTLWASNVIDIINTIAGTLLGGLMAVFLLGMFSYACQCARCTDRLGCRCVRVAARDHLDTRYRRYGISSVIPTWWYGAFTIFPTILVGSWRVACLPYPNPLQHRVLCEVANVWSDGGSDTDVRRNGSTTAVNVARELIPS